MEDTTDGSHFDLMRMFLEQTRVDTCLVSSRADEHLIVFCQEFMELSGGQCQVRPHKEFVPHKGQAKLKQLSLLARLPRIELDNSEDLVPSDASRNVNDFIDSRRNVESDPNTQQLYAAIRLLNFGADAAPFCLSSAAALLEQLLRVHVTEELDETQNHLGALHVNSIEILSLHTFDKIRVARQVSQNMPEGYTNELNVLYFPQLVFVTKDISSEYPRRQDGQQIKISNKFQSGNFRFDRMFCARAISSPRYCRQKLQTKEGVSKLQSAFMIDLAQVSLALRNCTARSVIILDEFGKGSLSTDGAGLFAGVINQLLKRGSNCPKVFASTHFHELFTRGLIPPELPISYAYMKVLLNSNVAQEGQRQAEITYLYRVTPGLCLDSYAAQCASMYGISKNIVERAQLVSTLLSRSEIGVLLDEDMPQEQMEELEVRAAICQRFISWKMSVDDDVEVKERLRGVLGK
ncbi:unnamed protein product [Rhizoctonia solani]|uniref:DNA mismatch repair proteins mutS family domain-containing protein n=1 Tax=Rhizoctonia solani TaxID=456999 RepID=A0A8H3B1M2_9AGAM|nr:unnamed protein product [Rhizoctonia solani]